MKKITYAFAILSLIMISCSQDDISTPLKQPSITQISPDYINAGSEITITGTDLNDNPTFHFNGEILEPTNITSSIVTLHIPENASSGKLEIAFTESGYKTESYLKILDSDWEVSKASNYIKTTFVSNTTAFALRVDSEVQKLKIDKTTDAGSIWSTIYEENIQETFFTAVNELVVWIKEDLNIFKKTTDGGHTWMDITILDISYLITDVIFKNEQEGFILASKLGKTYIFNTIDGGNTWIEKLEIDMPTHDIDIAYSNENTIHLLNKESNQLIKTIDNGENWTTSTLNIASNSNPIVYNFINENNIWLNMEPLINSSGGLFMTDDAGNNWENIEIPEFSETDEKIINLTFFNEFKGHILTDQGGNLYTNDGGETWKLFYVESGNITAVSSYESVMYIINNGKLYQKEI